MVIEDIDQQDRMHNDTIKEVSVFESVQVSSRQKKQPSTEVQ